MPERETYQKQAGRIISYFTSLMALFYLAAGFFLMFSNDAKKMFSVKFCLIIGIGLVIYGLFRIYRSFIYYTKGE
ncbi:MAG TPA: hypothetical protein VK590_10050 [Saprospiraceae bacterium]|nr:hypothetical protein [Saprospiraceae bacterium]